MAPTEPKLSAHLLKSHEAAFQAATQHEFLRAVAESRLPQDHLRSWLAQDRLYALAYTNFIGQLLAKAPLPTVPHRPQTLEWRIVDALIDSLTNIRLELKLFEDTAASEGFLSELDVRPNVATRAYQDLFAGSSAPAKPLIVGLMVLWATEHCYLTAWQFAKAHMSSELRDDDMDVMQRVFVPNWSSNEFADFVERLRELTDSLAEKFAPNSPEWIECEVAFAQVLKGELDFWPSGR